MATEKQKQQLADLLADRAAQGQSTDAFANLKDMVDETPPPPDDK